MITKDPESQVVAFDMLEWLAENEPSPKKEVKNFLCGRYEDISGNKVKAVAENEDEQDEVENDEDSNLRNLLLDTIYDHFSLTEGGDVLLTSEGDNSVSLLLTDADARDLLPKLKAKLEDRVAKLGRLLK